ncbi:MAG: catalase [Lachnospiraceae bacterium]|nr:catalase [Lachnospiraceae bacterium]MBQ8262454.1 catalase [Lachnospiraceae bacterium]
MQAWKHFKTITRHKYLVMKGCFAVGLYRQGLLHDLSKYMPSEFWVGAKYYQGNQSPNNAEREAKGYSSSWLHHKGRNKHHFEYWIDYSGKKVDEVMQPAKMPNRYIVEMFIDRVAASKVYNGMFYTDWDAWHYYNKGNTAQFLHPYTRRLLEKLLYMNGKYGEEATYRYIRKHVLHNLSS